MGKSNRKIALLLSDSHAWFNLGLINPESPIDNLRLNSSQLQLWDVFTTGINKTKELAGKDEIIVFHMGDITDGHKHPTDLVDFELSPQIIASAYNFIPILELPNVKKLRIVGGTYAHNFGDNSSEKIVKFALKNSYPRKDIDVINHGLVSVNGVIMDYSHHGPNVGNFLWTKGNSLRSYLRNYILTEIELGNRPADLVVRGHFHDYTREWLELSWGGDYFESWLIVMPPLCLMSGYARQSTKSKFTVSPGVIAVEIIDNKIVKIHPFIIPFDMRIKETL